MTYDDFSLTASPGRRLPVATRASGMRIWDRDGNEWLDACGGAMVMSLGHCHPRLVEAAQKQLEKLTFTYRFSFSNEPMIELAGLIREIAPDGPRVGVLQLVGVGVRRVGDPPRPALLAARRQARARPR